MAFDKLTGREVWKALTASEQGYCPPTMIEHGGAKQLLIWHADSLNSLNPLTGAVYWSVPLKPSYGMSIIAPRKLGDYLFASGIGNVGALLKLDGANGRRPRSSGSVWRKRPCIRRSPRRSWKRARSTGATWSVVHRGPAERRRACGRR